MKGLSIGKMDRVFIFQKSSEVINEFNTGVATWSNIASPKAWGTFAKDNGGESNISDQPTTVQKVTIYVRYRTDITVQMRFVCGSEIFNIVSIREPVGYRKQLLEIRAELNAEVTWQG